jgi:hypothetical protein
MKVCFKCKEQSSYEFFFKHKLTPDGYHSWCKKCCTEANINSRNKQNATIEGRAKVFLLNAKKSAAKRGHKFDLTFEDIADCWNTQQQTCAYSGRKMTLLPNQLNTVSIERIDSSVGYTKDNTILVCHAINRMKSNFKFDDFYNFCRDVAIFLGDNNLEINVGAYK